MFDSSILINDIEMIYISKGARHSNPPVHGVIFKTKDNNYYKRTLRGNFILTLCRILNINKYTGNHSASTEVELQSYLNKVNKLNHDAIDLTYYV